MATALAECEDTLSNLTALLDSCTAVAAQTEDPCTAPADSMVGWERDLHIACVFIMLVVSGLGTALPLVAKCRSCAGIAFLVCLCKCAGTGIVLACSLIHMLLPSQEALANECLPAEFSKDYPAFAFLYCMLGALLMQFLDFLLLRLVALWHQRVPTSEAASNSETAVDAATPTAVRGAGGHVHPTLFTEAMATKRLAAAYMLEFGMTAHSVIIGIALGVASDETARTLVVALAFHQFFEGVALGARLVDARMASRWHEFALAFIYSVSAPLGTAIGIGIVTTINPSGSLFLQVTGTFDGWCAGILLYVGFDLLLHDFFDDMERHCKGAVLMQLGMFLAMWAGAGVMAYIGRYA